MKVNWAQKLTSRKFWAAVIGFVTAILVAVGADSLAIEQTVSVITGGAVLIAYIIGEGMVDATRIARQLEAAPSHENNIQIKGFALSDGETEGLE